MSITRRGLHAEISRLDEIIDAANNQKAEQFDAYRKQMSDKGDAKPLIKTEIEAFKKAVRKLRTLKKKGDEVVEQQEELVDEIVLEIQRPKSIGTPVATRTRVAREPEPSVEEESARVPSEPSSSPAPRPHDDRRIEAEQNSVVAGSPSVDCSNVVSIARAGYGLPDDEFNEIPQECRRTESKVLQ